MYFKFNEQVYGPNEVEQNISCLDRLVASSSNSSMISQNFTLQTPIVVDTSFDLTKWLYALRKLL